MNRRIIINILSVALCSVQYAFAADMPTAAELADKVLARRRAIQTGHVKAFSDCWERGATVVTKWDIYFDTPNQKLRGDTTRPYGVRPADADSDEFTEVSCHGCYAGDMHFHCTDRWTDDGKTFVATASDPGTQDPTLVYVPDPRWFGLFPFNVMLMRHFNMEEYIGSKGWRSGSVAAEMLDGVDTWKVSYPTDGEGGTFTAWVAPSLDFNILRIESRFRQGDVDYEDVVEGKIEPMKGAIPFFPTRLAYRRMERRPGENNDARETMREDLRIDVVSFNEPIDPVVFSPQGIRVLRTGTNLSWASARTPPDQGLLVWDGSQFVQAIQQRAGVGDRYVRLRVVVYSGLAVLSAVLGIAVILRVAKMKRG